MWPSSNPLGAVISHFCTLETATSSVSVPLPAPHSAGHTSVLEGEEGWTKQLQCHPSPPHLSKGSAFHWILFLISYVSREQPLCTTSLHCTLAVQTWKNLFEPLLPCPLLALQVANVFPCPWHWLSYMWPCSASSLSAQLCCSLQVPLFTNI